MKPFLATLKEFWSRLSWLDITSVLIVVVGLFLGFTGLSGKLFSFLEYLAVLAGIYLLIRLVGWWRSKLLWSLRNRLIVAYLFIAFVPILLIVIMVYLGARILYSQLGAYLLHEDVHNRIVMMADTADHIAIAHQSLPSGDLEEDAEQQLAAQSQVTHDRELPGLTITFSDDLSILGNLAPNGERLFSGLMQEGDTLSLVSRRVIPGPKEQRLAILRVPVNSEFLATIAPDLGAIHFNLMERPIPGTPAGVLYSSGSQQYRVASRIVARNRFLQPAMFWLDSPVDIVCTLDAVSPPPSGSREVQHRPVLAVSNARPSRLTSRIFVSLGELRDTYIFLFVIVGIVFLLIEAAAFATGFVLTRRITRAVSGLYGATQYIKQGDFTHRIYTEHRDQLGELAESFNKMTGSISELIEEESKRRKLENEISIAREVQSQLFPSTLPSVPGVEIEAICKAARSVSGDYYDFIQLSPTHVAIAIADISGKGISAALLMASLQAALRSQLLAEGSEHLSTAELVSRLNRHLVRNTGDDRFATFFIAVYDSARRTLRYTNAGHLPSFLICHEAAHLLDKGGMVLGVVEEYVYEQGELEVAPNSLLVGYSDGLVEPENVYGEEFGIPRLKDAAVRAQGAAPLMVAESLMAAVEEWAGTPEQADDMTVLVARLR